MREREHVGQGVGDIKRVKRVLDITPCEIQGLTRSTLELRKGGRRREIGVGGVFELVV